MTIYTHNGVYYDLPTDDPDLAKQKIMAHVGADVNSQPKTVRDLQKQQLATVGDTVANAVTGTLDMLAYPIARQYYERIGGMSKEDAAARAVKETTSIKDPFGTKFGYKGQATYENAPQRIAGEFIGEGIQQGVVKPITEQTGLIESDVGNMVNLGMLAGGAVAPKVIAPIKAAGGAVSDVATGFGGRFGTRPGIAKPGTEPKIYQKPSALEPAGKEYLPPEIKQQLDAGVITPEQANQQFKAWNAEQVQALQQTKGMVPLADQKWQGVGEMLADPYTSPRGWLPDVGLAALGYGVGALTGAGPLMAGLPPLLNLARKGYQAVNAGKTINAAGQLHDVGFTRMSPEIRAQLAQAQKNPQPLQPGPMPAAGAVQPPTPQAMAAAQINPAAAQTPAAQAAVNTTQTKAKKSQWGASANYDINSGAGNVKIQTPAGPMNVKFNSKGQPEPIVEPQITPPVQTTGAVAPSGPSYNVPTQTVPQVKPFFRPMPAQTKINMPTQGPAVPMPMKPMASPVSEPQYTGYKIAGAPTFTKVQKQSEPHANTPLIERALAEKVAANPKLEEFSKPYITPDNLKEPIGKFLSNETPSIIAEGGPGTGKSSLAQEWKRLNPEGHLVKITANSLKDSKTLNAILEKAQTQANDKLLFLIDEADTFTNPGKSTSLKHLNTLKTEMSTYGDNVKFLYTTNKIENVPKFINDVPVVKVDTKLTPDERSTYALKIARDYNVNKTPAEIQAIADDARLTNFRDVKKAISEGYSFKEPPIFSYAKSAEKLMPNTPKNITSTLDNFVNNELDRNVLIFDSSAYAKDPQLSAKLNKYVTKNSSEFNVNDLSERLLKGNSAGGDPIRIIVNKDNLSDIKALKSEFELGNEKLHPWNFILEDPSNLLIGKESLPLRSRAHVIDGKMWNNAKPAVDAKTVDLATAIKSGVETDLFLESPKTKPVVFNSKNYTSGAEMRKDLIKQKISPYDIDKLMNKYFPGE